MARNADRGLARTGRFTSENSGMADKEFMIIRGGEGILRIYNSSDADAAFDVKPAGNHTGAPSITVNKKCSAELALSGDVYIKHGANTTIEGMYEFLGPLHSARSGRFKGDNQTVIIARGLGDKVYRILNSGKRPFTVRVGGTDIADVHPRQSLDVSAGHTLRIHSANEFQGIYDCLDDDHPVRSGRFRIKLNAATPRLIIKVAEAAWYRIFNSGEHDILVREDGVDLYTLAPDQSFDFKVTGAEITVQSLANNDPIQGIYDFIRVK